MCGFQFNFYRFKKPALIFFSGYLEVEIVSLKKVVHSKKDGDGYVDNDAKKQKIYKAIEEALNA